MISTFDEEISSIGLFTSIHETFVRVFVLCTVLSCINGGHIAATYIFRSLNDLNGHWARDEVV